jgi:hypothetical protein
MQVPPAQQPPSQHSEPHWNWDPGQHLPALHWPVWQAKPQAPQLLGSVEVLTQAPPHTWGSVAGQAQRPSAHTSRASTQAVPHAPQFAASLRRLVHRSPAAQKSGRAAGQAQAPPLQIPPARVQRLPQAPQLP